MSKGARKSSVSDTREKATQRGIWLTESHASN